MPPVFAVRSAALEFKSAQYLVDRSSLVFRRNGGTRVPVAIGAYGREVQRKFDVASRSRHVHFHAVRKLSSAECAEVGIRPAKLTLIGGLTSLHTHLFNQCAVGMRQERVGEFRRVRRRENGVAVCFEQVETVHAAFHVAGARHEEFVPEERLQGVKVCLLYTSPSPRDLSTSRMPSSA